MNREGDNSNETVDQVNAPLFLRRHESEPVGAAPGEASGSGDASKPPPLLSSARDAQAEQQQQQQQHSTELESQGDQAFKSEALHDEHELKGKRKAETGKSTGETAAAAKKGARKSWKKPKVRCFIADAFLRRVTCRYTRSSSATVHSITTVLILLP
jgi:hypothetical protein